MASGGWHGLRGSVRVRWCPAATWSDHPACRSEVEVVQCRTLAVPIQICRSMAAARSPGKWLAAASAGTLGCQLVDDPDGYSGERVAAGYDDPANRMFQPEAIDPAVSLLAELAGSGPALGLAIGPRRIGPPLSQRGQPGHGLPPAKGMAG